MLFSQTQLWYIFGNLLVILVGIGLTFLAIKKLKLTNKSSKLLFVLYIVYWMATLITRDYTGLIQIHFDIRIDAALWLLVPIVAYGLIGIFYRPLSDLMSLKFKSRKTVIYISLVIQLALALPMFFYPCVATNIAQSIGAGIGAGCIGLFNLMFNEHEIRQNSTSVTSILLIPPLIAQFFASAIICVVVSFVKLNHVGTDYVSVVKHLWIIAALVIVAAMIIAIFVKERGQTLYQKKVVKKVVESKWDKTFFILVCVMAVFMGFVKWSVTGATASIQIAYLSKQLNIDTRAFEGYASLISSIGQLAGVILSNWFLNKKSIKYRRLWCLVVATIVALAYGFTNSYAVHVYVFVFTGCLAGFTYGVFTNIILGRIVKTTFKSKNPIFTPVGLYTTSLAIGMTFGLFANAWCKMGIFENMYGYSTYTFADFKIVNAHVNVMFMFFVVLDLVLYFIIRRIAYKHKLKKSKTIKKQYAATTGDTEM